MPEQVLDHAQLLFDPTHGTITDLITVFAAQETLFNADGSEKNEEVPDKSGRPRS